MTVEEVRVNQVKAALASANALARGLFHDLIATRINVDEVEWVACECGAARPVNGQTCSQFLADIATPDERKRK